MRPRLAIVLAVSLFLSAPSFAQDPPGAAILPEDFVEISPDLFLLVQRAIRQNRVEMQVTAIRRANDFAASRGGVVVPVSGDYGELNIAQRVYRYQFRVMSREQALALNPVLPDSLITVHNTGGCAPPGHAMAALHALTPQQTLNLVAVQPMLLPGAEPPKDSASPAICLPGTVCDPGQLCLPGWQCSPGMPPMPETPPAAPTPPTASLR